MCCIWQLLESSIIAISSIGKKSEASRVFAGDDDADDDDSELFSFCSQLAAEDELLAPVHEALSVWESCCPSHSASKKRTIVYEETVDWTVSINYVEVLVIICKLMEVIIYTRYF